MKAEAAEAEARLQKLKQAGSESWTALSGALAESRKAFDQANQAAQIRLVPANEVGQITTALAMYLT